MGVVIHLRNADGKGVVMGSAMKLVKEVGARLSIVMSRRWSFGRRGRRSNISEFGVSGQRYDTEGAGRGVDGLIQRCGTTGTPNAAKERARTSPRGESKIRTNFLSVVGRRSNWRIWTLYKETAE